MVLNSVFSVPSVAKFLSEDSMATTTIPVGGMSCQKCVASLTGVLSKLPGVEKAEVLLEPGQATVTYDPAQVGEARLREAVEDAGFDAL